MTATATAIRPNAAPSLVSKLARIQQALGRIKERGRNKEQGYTFADEGDINEAVVGACSELNVFISCDIVPGTATVEQVTYGRNDTKTFAARVEVRMVIADGDSDETIEKTGYGFAFDTTDKAVNKAFTSGAKYLTKHVFRIRTGEDPDGAPQRQTKPEEVDAQRAPSTILAGIPDLARAASVTPPMLKKLVGASNQRGITDYRNLAVDEAQAVIASLKRMADERARTQAEPPIGDDPPDDPDMF